MRKNSDVKWRPARAPGGAVRRWLGPMVLVATAVLSIWWLRPAIWPTAEAVQHMPVQPESKALAGDATGMQETGMQENVPQPRPARQIRRSESRPDAGQQEYGYASPPPRHQPPPRRGPADY